MLKKFFARPIKAVTVDNQTHCAKKKQERHRALAIDLVLHEILSYLSPPELRHIRLVCKQWDQLCGRFRQTNKKWSSTQGYSTDLARELANVHSLQLEFNKYVRTTVDPAVWLLFWQTISQARRRNQLQRLEFGGEVRVEEHVMPLLHEIRWVTSLCLNDQVARKLDIQTVLESLPRLRQLELSGAVLHKKSDDAVLPLNRLTDLHLDNCHVASGFLEELLDACPLLGFLRLTSMYSINTSGRGRNPSLDALSLAKRRCPTATPVLDEVFLETWNCLDILAALQEMPRYLQRATKFRYRIHAQSYWKTYTTVSLEYLTRLEIRGKYWHHDFPVEALHTYLCHDDARHLRELVALDIYYPDEYLDLDRLRQKGVSAWSSRRLEVLRIGFGPEEERYGDSKKKEKRPCHFIRNMIGYIIGVCPRLTDLWIRRKAMDFSLESGLCGLTRLQRLRTFKIQTVEVPVASEHDLVWLFPRCAQLFPLSRETWRSIRARMGRNGGAEAIIDSVRMMEKICRSMEGDITALQANSSLTANDGTNAISSLQHDASVKHQEEQGEDESKGEDRTKGDRGPSIEKLGLVNCNPLAQLQSLIIEYSSEKYLSVREEKDMKESIPMILERMRPKLEVLVYQQSWIERQYNHP